MKTEYIAVCILLVALIITCSEEDSESVISERAGPDTLIVSVTDTLGLLMGDSTYMFGTITQASLGSDGIIYVLDSQRGKLSIFSQDFSLAGTVGSLGSGPGQFQYPQSFAFLHDGRLAICDWGGRSVLFFDDDMTFLDMHYGYFPSSPRFIVPGPDNTYIAMNIDLVEEEDNVEGTSYIARYGSEMEPAFIFDSWPLMISIAPAGSGENLSIGRVDHDFDSDAAGNLYLAEKDDSTYCVEVFYADGSSGILVEKDWVQVAKTQEEIDREVYEETLSDSPEGTDVGRRTFRNIFPWHNAISSVNVDCNGDIWVGQGYTGTPTFEVYSPDGELLYVAVIPELDGAEGIEYCFRNGYLAYDRQPVDYPKVYMLEVDN